MKDKELEMMELDLKELKRDIIRKQIQLIFDATGLQSSEIIIGTWDCPKSPIGTCVYDRYEDPACDDCVFCHEPDERK